MLIWSASHLSRNMSKHSSATVCVARHITERSTTVCVARHITERSSRKLLGSVLTMNITDSWQFLVSTNWNYSKDIQLKASDRNSRLEPLPHKKRHQPDTPDTDDTAQHAENAAGDRLVGGRQGCRFYPHVCQVLCFLLTLNKQYKRSCTFLFENKICRRLMG